MNVMDFITLGIAFWTKQVQNRMKGQEFSVCRAEEGPLTNDNAAGGNSDRHLAKCKTVSALEVPEPGWIQEWAS